MEITRGKIKAAQKVVVYGPEGIGKSTFASQFPEPLFGRRCLRKCGMLLVRLVCVRHS